MKLTYGPREAIRYMSRIGSIELTDTEITALIAASGDAIEAKGQAVRVAAQEYEAFVIRLSAEMVARRDSNTEHEAPMNGLQRS